MSENVIKFPYSASRRVHSQKPRRSKNGTPEERAAKAAALFPTSTDVVPMADAREQARSEVDGRKLRGSPPRDCTGTISFGATVVGKMHTAGLKGKPLATIQPKIRKKWLQTLDRAHEGPASLSVAMKTLEALQSETSDFPVNLPVARLGTTCPKFSGRARSGEAPGADRLGSATGLQLPRPPMRLFAIGVELRVSRSRCSAFSTPMRASMSQAPPVSAARIKCSTAICHISRSCSAFGSLVM